MSQHYTNPARESDPYALPGVEVWYHNPAEDPEAGLESGWYYWSCFPGCLPDGDPVGPFATEDEAVEDMRENWGDDGD